MDREIELRHLRYFVAVAEELHFGRAAKRLHLAQPPLSQQIRILERIVGFPLFFRTSRAVRLTAAGETLLTRARLTLQNVQEHLAEARSIGRGEIGSLSVGFTGSSMLAPLPSMLGRYRREFPLVNLQLHEGYTSRIVDGISRGTLDVGFLRDGGPIEGLNVEALYSEPFVAVLPLGHPLATHSTLSAAALRNEPFVLFSPTAGSHAYEKTVSLCEAHGFRPRVVQEAPQWLTLLRLVGAGLGVTIAPACARQIASREVVCLPLQDVSVLSDIEFAFRAGEDRPIVNTFAAIARSSFLNGSHATTPSAPQMQIPFSP